MTIFVNFTYWVVSLRYDRISLTIFLDSVRFFAFLSSVIWCVIWWIWCILTRFLKLCSLLIHISDNYFTFWLFFKFVDISDGWFWFINCTFNWIRWFKVAIAINLTYRIITLRYDLIGLTIFTLDCVWFFIFFSSVIWCIVWWVWCVLTRFLNLFTLLINISDNNFTFWFFFQLVDISDVFILFCHFSSCRIWRLKVTFLVYFTNFVNASWNQFISLTLEFNLLWTTILCFIVFVDWLLFFGCYRIFNGRSFCILIMNVDITFNIWFAVVVCHIRRNFFDCWKREVIKEWWIAWSFISWSISTDDVRFIVSNWINICWKLRRSGKGVSSGFIEPTTQTRIPTIWSSISCYFKVVLSILTINKADLFRFSCCSSRCWFLSWLNRIWGIYQCIIT